MTRVRNSRELIPSIFTYLGLDKSPFRFFSRLPHDNDTKRTHPELERAGLDALLVVQHVELPANRLVKRSRRQRTGCSGTGGLAAL